MGFGRKEMNIQDYKEATKRLNDFSEWANDIATDKAEKARKAAATVRFLMSLLAAKEQFISELRKPKFPSGGIKSIKQGIEGIIKSDKSNYDHVFEAEKVRARHDIMTKNYGQF